MFFLQIDYGLKRLRYKYDLGAGGVEAVYFLLLLLPGVWVGEQVGWLVGWLGPGLDASIKHVVEFFPGGV